MVNEDFGKITSSGFVSEQQKAVRQQITNFVHFFHASMVPPALVSFIGRTMRFDLKVLREMVREEALKEDHPEPTYDAGHVPAVRVPKGGSSCSTCRFGSKDGKNCGNEHFVAWNNGDSRLPYPADEFCSDWWEPKEPE